MSIAQRKLLRNKIIIILLLLAVVSLLGMMLFSERVNLTIEHKDKIINICDNRVSILVPNGWDRHTRQDDTCWTQMRYVSWLHANDMITIRAQNYMKYDNAESTYQEYFADPEAVIQRFTDWQTEYAQKERETLLELKAEYLTINGAQAFSTRVLRQKLQSREVGWFAWEVIYYTPQYAFILRATCPNDKREIAEPIFSRVINSVVLAGAESEPAAQ